MEIPVEYQVLFGSSIAGLIIFIIRYIRDYLKEQKGESQKLAVISIILGVFIIVPFLGAIGLLLAIISFFTRKNKSMSKIAILVNILSILPWLAVLIFGT